MKLAEMSERVPEEWMQKMEDIERELTPGLPLAEQVAAMMQQNELQQELAQQLGITANQEQQLGGFGSMAVEGATALSLPAF